MKMADTEQLDAEDYLLIADPWRQDWEKGVQVPVNEGIVNEANIKLVNSGFLLTAPTMLMICML